MNHFPETTAALRRLARAIADLFKSPSQRYAELCLKHEIEILEAEYENFKRVEKLRKKKRHIPDYEYEVWESDPRNNPASPWWRVKDCEKTETGEK